MKRGQIWVVAGSGYSSKPRPAVVVQADQFDTDSVTVCLLTSTEVDAPLIRLPIPADEVTGISKPSYAMVDKVTTIKRSNASEHVGELPAPLIDELNSMIATFLGLPLASE